MSIPKQVGTLGEIPIFTGYHSALDGPYYRLDMKNGSIADFGCPGVQCSKCVIREECIGSLNTNELNMRASAISIIKHAVTIDCPELVL